MGWFCRQIFRVPCLIDVANPQAIPLASNPLTLNNYGHPQAAVGSAAWPKRAGRHRNIGSCAQYIGSFGEMSSSRVRQRAEARPAPAPAGRRAWQGS